MKQIKTVVTVLALATGLMFAQSCADPCKDVNCGANGECVEGVCDCSTGYEGDQCEIEVRTKFLGTYAFSENCNTGSDTYTVTVNTHGSDVNKIRITNIYNAGLTIDADVSGSSLTIPSQSFGTATISGSGSVSGTNLTLAYSITTSAGATDSCTGTGTK